MKANQSIASAVFFMAPLIMGIKYVDLSHEYNNEKSMTWPTASPFQLKVEYKGLTKRGYWYESNSFCMVEHSGTHIDAPAHFAKDVLSVDKIPLTHLVDVHGVVMDIREKVAADPIAQLTAYDVSKWLKEHGPLPDKVIVFVHTGWSARYGNKTAYFGTSTNDTSNLIFPGIHIQAAELLTRYKLATGRQVVGVGLDTPSLDYGPSKDFVSHIEFAKSNIYGLENLKSLAELPIKGFKVTVLPMKIEGGSGGPVRVVATLP